MKSGVPLPMVVGNGFGPKSRWAIVCGSPLYQTPSCDVSPKTTSGEGEKPWTLMPAGSGIVGPLTVRVALVTATTFQEGLGPIWRTWPYTKPSVSHEPPSVRVSVRPLTEKRPAPKDAVSACTDSP